MDIIQVAVIPRFISERERINEHMKYMDVVKNGTKYLTIVN